MQNKTPTQISELTREEMKQMLKKGDYERLSDITGFSVVYVLKVFNGLRNSEFLLYIGRKYLALREDLRSEAHHLRELTLLPEKY